MKINICFATDENYVPYMATAIVSVLKNAAAEDDLHFYILSNEISDTSKEKILSLQKIKNCTFTFIDVDEAEFKSCPVFNKYISITMYYRYKIAELCPDITKIIYLDCDIIVLSSLAELFNTDIENYYIAGVEDIGYTFWRKYNPSWIHKGFYINSGVILMNLIKWRADNICQKLFTYTKQEKDKIKIGDQDAINAILHDRCLPLNYKWNVQDSFYKRYFLINHPHKSELLTILLLSFTFLALQSLGTVFLSPKCFSGGNITNILRLKNK